MAALHDGLMTAQQHSSAVAPFIGLRIKIRVFIRFLIAARLLQWAYHWSAKESCHVRAV